MGGIVGGIIGFIASGFNPAGFMYGFQIGPALGGCELVGGVMAADE